MNIEIPCLCFSLLFDYGKEKNNKVVLTLSTIG